MALAEKYGDLPLRLLLVGHNPSEHSWDSGHYFSQPSNNFWKLITESGLLEEDVNANDDEMLEKMQIGFTDVIRVPNSKSNAITRRFFVEQRSFFYKRIITNAHRVGGSPERIAFVGKRQFAMLFDPPLKKVELGLQELNPPGFPFDSEIWVLSTPSGRSPMKWEERVKPYEELALAMQYAFLTSNIE
jgi:TDG/mug DNA glycosylase family protein